MVLLERSKYSVQQMRLRVGIFDGLLVELQHWGGLHKHKDLTNHDFSYPPYARSFNQNVRSLFLCDFSGP